MWIHALEYQRTRMTALSLCTDHSLDYHGGPEGETFSYWVGGYFAGHFTGLPTESGIWYSHHTSVSFDNHRYLCSRLSKN